MSYRQLQEEEEELDSEVEDDYEPADQEQLAAYKRQLSLRADQSRFSAPSSPTSSRRQEYLEPKPVERYLSEPNLSEPGPSGTRRLRIPPASYVVPPLPPILPERSTSAGRDAPIVKRYRDPKTGYINLKRLREETKQVTGPRKKAIRFLTESSKIHSEEVQGKDHKDKELRQKKMQKPGFIEKDRNRWAHPLKTRERFPNYVKKQLVPKDRDREPDMRDPRFNKLMKEMQIYKTRPTSLLPTGRMGYGDISKIDTPELRKMFADAKRKGTAQEFNVGAGIVHEDPKHWNPKQLAFSSRLRSLDSEDIRRYEEFQAQTNPYLKINHPAVEQLVPRPTIYYLREHGKDRNKQYMADLPYRHAMTRKQRIDDVKNRARLDSAINPHRTPIMKPISEDESVEYEYETYEHDPETHLILDLFREEQKRERKEERAEALRAQAELEDIEDEEPEDEDSDDEDLDEWERHVKEFLDGDSDDEDLDDDDIEDEELDDEDSKIKEFLGLDSDDEDLDDEDIEDEEPEDEDSHDEDLDDEDIDWERHVKEFLDEDNDDEDLDDEDIEDEEPDDETQGRQRESFERMMTMPREQQQEMNQRMQPQQEQDMYVPVSTSARSNAYVPAAPVAFDPSQPSGSGLSQPAYGGRQSATQPPSLQASGPGLSLPAYRGRPILGRSEAYRGRPILGRRTEPVPPPPQRHSPEDKDSDED